MAQRLEGHVLRVEQDLDSRLKFWRLVAIKTAATTPRRSIALSALAPVALVRKTSWVLFFSWGLTERRLATI
jgi:hypothetical protein